jgi:DNA-binding transcriptional ArsR family regulator
MTVAPARQVEMSEADLGVDLIALVARRLSVIAEPTRIQLMLFLERREATVQQLADELGAPHQNVSKHLNVLHQAGILARRREGSCAVYSLADYTGCALVRLAAASVTGYIEELADVANLSG